MCRETRTNRMVMQEVKDFMQDKKRILVFSGKGDTGMDYHASNEVQNQRQRHHYLLQPGWQADKAVQGLGRTHRTNQRQAPIYHLLQTDLPAEKRFISSIARRLDQLGALTRGQRTASSQGLFDERDNLESQYATDALYQYFRDLVAGRDVSLDFNAFSQQSGLKLIDPRTGNLRSDLPPITQFLNRLLAFTKEGQEAVFGDFSARLDNVIELAIQQGTFNVGMETLRADRIQQVRQITIAHDDTTGADTQYVELKVGVRSRPLQWGDVPKRLAALKRNRNGGDVVGYVVNNRSQRPYVVVSALPANDRGNLIEQYRRLGVAGESLILKADMTAENYKKVDEADFQRLWAHDIAALPEFLDHTEHLITGVLLPHWDKLPQGQGVTRVYRLRTDDGETMIGRVIPPKHLDKTLHNFGVTREGAATPTLHYTAEDALARVLAHGTQLTMSNGWTLTPSRIGGEARVELKGLRGGQVSEAREAGVLFERLGYAPHYFLPTGVRGAEVFAGCSWARRSWRKASPRPSNPGA